MGFLDKLFGKKKREQEQVAEVEVTPKTAEADEETRAEEEAKAAEAVSEVDNPFDEETPKDQ